VGQTTDQIESDIEKTRDDLGANLQELEQRVKEVTDWRYHFRNHPMTLIGAAFGGGILLATMVSRTRSTSHAMPAPAPVRHKATETWDLIKDALVGVAAARVTDFVGELVPGFAEEYGSRVRRTPSSPAPPFLT
jgi:hypothetical protein